MPNFQVNMSFEAIGPKESRNLPGIIFLHEIAFCKETWKLCLKPIADATGRMVVAYDTRNHGDSGWITNLSYESMMEDLKNIMEHLHMPKAVLVGHGMGGKTAMEFALKFPDLVEKIVVEDMSLKYQNGGENDFCMKYFELLTESLNHIPPHIKDLENAKEFLASYIQQRIPEEYRGDKKGEITKAMMPLEIDSLSGKFEWKLHLKLFEYSVKNAFEAGPELGGFRVFKYEGEYQGPALFLCGSRSPYKVLKDKDFIVSYLKNATFKEIEGGGHLLHIDFPEKFCEEVAQFINT
ncbi:sn-1-specific diacylglycerol lipase ABHD11 [Parasteatoda tepidariorum]|uniref:sn-1-specific diacylglycerol lipase ABHD11 n=1 Tax=Parasteatoda tepidariorum TaxID=114398 RepID=UPI00077FAEC2|nr:protein ABHD11 [Parasteatoda tepidariorum]